MKKRKYSKAEKIHALKVYELCDGNLSAASRETGIPRMTLAKWVTEIVSVDESEVTNNPSGDERLTDKQEKFVDSWIDSHNATDAARKAGYAGDDNVLAVTGHDNLRNPKIQERIQERLFSAARLTKDEIIGTLAEHMRADVTDCMNDAGYFSLERAKERKVTHLIKKIKYDMFGSISEIEFHNQQAAADKLAGIFGLKQKRAENQLDAEAKRRTILNKAAELAERQNTTPDVALDRLLKARPELARWIQ